MPPYLPGGVNDFVELVIPELQRRGLFRTEYEGRTLRVHLGLARPGWTKTSCWNGVDHRTSKRKFEQIPRIFMHWR